MSRRSRGIVAAWSILTLALGAASAVAQTSQEKPRATPTSPWARLFGNWDMTFTKDGRPIAKGHFAFHDTPAARSGAAAGVLTETTIKVPDRDLPCRDGRIYGSDVELDCWPYAFQYMKLTISPDRNTLRGTWANRRDGEPEGQVLFTRTGPASIDRLEIVAEDAPARHDLDYSEMTKIWATRDKKPRIRLRLRGANLPIWIGSSATPKRDAVINDPSYRIVDESVSREVYKQRWSLGLMEIVVELEPGAQPGQKTLTVNGGQRAFEVQFTNYGVKVVELKFVRKDGTQLADAVRYGEEFFVEARFSGAPAESQRVVKLEWAGGTREIPVFKQKEGNVFRSAPLSLAAPPTPAGAAPAR